MKNNNIFKFSLTIVAFVFILFAVLLYVSPQKTPLFLDDNGDIIKNSIAEIKDIEINGVKQRVLIRGKNLSNPILLHLHGGPGGPDRPLMDRMNNLEDVFTVCYWDQRGAGASYSNKIPVESMNQNQVIEDGIEISKYLIERFKKEKIYLEAHSWGTLFGIQMASRKPNLFYAYFGVGQGANSLESEQLSFDFVYESAKKENDINTLNKLKEIGRPPYFTDGEWVKNILIERQLLKEYEGPSTKKKLSRFTIYKDFVFYPEYSIKDKWNALKGSPFSLKNLWPEAKQTNLFKNSIKFKIPIYIFQGKYDMTTVTSVSKKYFDVIEAPEKEYYIFENSAHWPHINEFKKYKLIIKSIVEPKKVLNKIPFKINDEFVVNCKYLYPQ